MKPGWVFLARSEGNKAEQHVKHTPLGGTPREWTSDNAESLCIETNLMSQAIYLPSLSAV